MADVGSRKEVDKIYDNLQLRLINKVNIDYCRGLLVGHNLALNEFFILHKEKGHIYILHFSTFMHGFHMAFIKCSSGDLDSLLAKWF